MSHPLFVAGRIKRGVRVFDMPIRKHVSMQRTYKCTNLDCAEPREAITVSLWWEPGIGGIGLLAGWTAGDVVAHCGCVLAEHEIAALAAEAEHDVNEWGQTDGD